MAINLNNKSASTNKNKPNKIVLPKVANQRKYSIKKVKIKYNKPIVIKRSDPFINSLV